MNEYYSFLNSALETDTSHMELFDDLGTHLIYCKIDTCDFIGVISKLKVLESIYPEFASATPLEQKSVMDYAITNDDNLRKKIGIKVKPFKRTRSGNYEDAFVSMMCYPFNGYFFFRDDTRIQVLMINAQLQHLLWLKELNMADMVGQMVLVSFCMILMLQETP